MIGRNTKQKRYLCKCVCKESSQELLKSNLTCTEDLSSVISLPDQWVPQKSGPTLLNYLKKTEDNYKASLGRMSRKIFVINNDIDKKNRDLSEKLYTHTKENHYTIKGILNDFMISDKSPEARDVALEEIEKVYDENIRDIEQFKNNIFNQETLRSEELKCNLNDEYKRLISIEDYNKKKIFHDINEQISALNGQLFTNLRTDFGLVCQLRSHLDKLLYHTRYIINRNCITLTVTSDNANMDEKPLENKIEEELDVKKVIICLVDAGQCAISKICAIFYNNLDDLQKNISSSVKDEVLSNFEQKIDDGLQCFFDCCAQNDSLSLDNQIRVCIDYMKDSFCGFGQNICITYGILYDICNILKAPSVRLALAQKLTLAQIDDFQIQSDVNELTFEITFNIALEKMLAGFDEDNVNSLFAGLENLLQQQADSYFKHSLNEVYMIKEYLKLIFLVIDMFYAESAYFLNVKSSIFHLIDEKIPPEYDLDPDLLSFSKRTGFLPRTILEDKNENTSLTYWNKKFLASIEAEILSLRDILNEQGEKWIDENSLFINMRYSLKSKSHVLRMERILAARNERIAEILSNQTRLQSHLDTIYQLIETLITEAAQFVDFDSEALYPLNYWVEQIQNNISRLISMSDTNKSKSEIDPILRTLKLKSYSLRLIKYRKLFEESLESAANAYRNNVDVRLQCARVSNYNVMKEIKLFSEGGRYAIVEASKAFAALVKASDALESCVNVINSSVNHCQTQLLSRAEGLLLPVIQIANSA